MGLRIREPERAAPRAAEYLPALELQMAAQPLHVGDEVPGRVRFERGMRAAPARAALVEDDDPIASGIEKSPRVDVAAAARPAVHEHGGLARRVTRLLVVHLVAVSDREIARVERLDRRILRPVAHVLSVATLRRSPSALILTQLAPLRTPSMNVRSLESGIRRMQNVRRSPTSQPEKSSPSLQ